MNIIDTTTGTNVTQIADDLFRVSTPVPPEVMPGGFTFNQFLLVDREPLCRALEMLRHGRHDVLVFHVLDEEELTFPFAGTTRFEGMEELAQVLCDPRSLRDGYLEALQEYLVEVRRGCARKGIDYQLVHTREYLDAVLAKFLHHRMAMFKSAAKMG